MARYTANTSLDPWFTLDGDECAHEIQTLVDKFKSEQAGRRERYIRNLELYEGRRLGGYTGQSYTAGVEPGNSNRATDADRMRLIRSAVSSAVASIYGPQKPKPQFQTLGATWAVRRKAYKLDRIVEGILNQRQDRWINVWAFLSDASVDAALQGVAPIKVTADRLKKRINHRLVLLPDLYVDPAEGRTPQSLFERAPIDVYSALQLYPKARLAIESAKEYNWYGLANSASRPRASKVIEILYAWRLPLGPDEPGRYIAQINGTVVEDEPWIAPQFPFVFLLWEPHRAGFWASGLGDEGGDLAREIGEVDLRLYYRELVASGKKIYYMQGSVKPDDLVLNDAVVAVPVQEGSVFPQESPSIPFNPMELEYLQSKVTAFWDSIGISQVSAAARREENVQSRVGQLTVNELKAGRQLVKSQRYEQAFVDLAHQYIWRLRELAEDNPDFAVTWPGKSVLRQVNWGEADVDDDMFTVQVAPASALPHDPEGRQDMVETLYKNGFISQTTAKSLIGWPDLDREFSLSNAETEYIDMLIERYLDADEDAFGPGDYDAPQGFIRDKVGAIATFAGSWFRAKVDQASLKKDKEKQKVEFALGLLSRWIKEMDQLITPPTPQMPTPPDQLPQAPTIKSQAA